MTSNVKLTKVKKGYLLEVADEHTSNQWAITKEELLLIWTVIRDEVQEILKEVED